MQHDMEYNQYKGDLLQIAAGTAVLFLIWANTGYASNKAIMLAFACLFCVSMYRIEVPDSRAMLLLTVTGVYILFLWGLCLAVNWNSLGPDYAPQMFKLLLAYVYHAALIVLFCNRRRVLAKAVGCTLWMNVGFYWAQLITFYTTSVYLDPLSWLGIREQKPGIGFFAGTDLAEKVFIRPAGFVNEPGTYGSIILLLLIVHYLTDRRLKCIHIAALLSMLASLSMFAIIGAVLFCGMLVIERMLSGSTRKRKKFLVILVVGACVVVFVPLIMQYMDLRFYQGKGDGGIGIREYLLHFWLTLPLGRRLLGGGLLLNDAGMDYFGGAGGLLFNLIYTLGLFLLPLILAFRAYCRTNIAFCYFAIVFLVKIPSLNYYVLWATLACLYLLVDVNRVGVEGRD